MGVDYMVELYIGWVLDTQKIIEYILAGTEFKTYKELVKHKKKYNNDCEYICLTDLLIEMENIIPIGWKFERSYPRYDSNEEECLIYLCLKDVPTKHSLSISHLNLESLSIDYIFNKLKQDLDNSDLEGATTLAHKLGGEGEATMLTSLNIF